jgi:hypothetical protein
MLKKALEIRNRLREQSRVCDEMTSAESSTGGRDEISRGEKGAIIGALNRSLGCDEHRRVVLAWLFMDSFVPMSTKSLTEGQWRTLRDWIGSWKNEDRWEVSEDFSHESVIVLNEVLRAFLGAKNADRAKFEKDRPLEALLGAVDLGGVIVEVMDEVVTATDDDKPVEPLTAKTGLKHLKADDNIESIF